MFENMNVNAIDVNDMNENVIGLNDMDKHNHTDELRTLQMLELKVLLEIKQICEKHNIQYFLIGGTLLGAVRHKGFIPWDDDIDIGMFRSEYERFLEIAPTELGDEFFLHTNESDKNFQVVFAKVRLNNTEYREAQYPESLTHNGIFVDIFPFDYVSNSKCIRKYDRTIFAILDEICFAKYGFHHKHTGYKIAIVDIIHIISILVTKNAATRLRDHFMKKHLSCPTDYVRNYPFWDTEVETLLKRQDVEFEGIIFPAPDADRYLKRCYGDYMQLPPENERKCHSPYHPVFGKYAYVKTVDDILKNKE